MAPVIGKGSSKARRKQASADFADWNSSIPITLQLGDFDGWIDEVVVRSSTVNGGTIANQAPTVSLSAAVSVPTAPATINLTAVAADSDGSIVKVEFFNGATKIGEDTSAPFTFAWANHSPRWCG